MERNIRRLLVFGITFLFLVLFLVAEDRVGLVEAKQDVKLLKTRRFTQIPRSWIQDMGAGLHIRTSVYDVAGTRIWYPPGVSVPLPEDPSVKLTIEAYRIKPRVARIKARTRIPFRTAYVLKSVYTEDGKLLYKVSEDKLVSLFHEWLSLQQKRTYYYTFGTVWALIFAFFISWFINWLMDYWRELKAGG